MNPLKVLGLDSVALVFFQKFWLTMGNSVMRAVLSALKSGAIPPSINHIDFVLIPKDKNAEVVGDSLHQPMQCYIQTYLKSYL